MAMMAPVTSRIDSIAASFGESFLLGHQPLDVLEHHDRVVDDDAGREHDREQRQRVDA